MSDEERRQHVNQLRTLRTSPQAFGKMLRQKAAGEEDEDETELGVPTSEQAKRISVSKAPAKAKATAADVMKDLGL